MNFNKAIIAGRLTQDPEARSLPSGQSVVSFSVATNRVWKNQSGEKQEAVEFHNVVSFGKLADICSSYLKKGQLILVEGRIQTRSWQGQDGVKRYRTEIVMENMQMGPKAGGGSPVGNTNSRPSQVQQNESIPVVEEDDVPQPVEEEIDVKDIPF
jgi:single-strand DNA-binding protein